MQPGLTIHLQTCSPPLNAAHSHTCSNSFPVAYLSSASTSPYVQGWYLNLCVKLCIRWGRALALHSQRHPLMWSRRLQRLQVSDILTGNLNSCSFSALSNLRPGPKTGDAVSVCHRSHKPVFHKASVTTFLHSCNPVPISTAWWHILLPTPQASWLSN